MKIPSWTYRPTIWIITGNIALLGRAVADRDYCIFLCFDFLYKYTSWNKFYVFYLFYPPFSLTPCTYIFVYEMELILCDWFFWWSLHTWVYQQQKWESWWRKEENKYMLTLRLEYFTKPWTRMGAWRYSSTHS